MSSEGYGPRRRNAVCWGSVSGRGWKLGVSWGGDEPSSPVVPSGKPGPRWDPSLVHVNPRPLLLHCARGRLQADAAGDAGPCSAGAEDIVILRLPRF